MKILDLQCLKRQETKYHNLNYEERDFILESLFEI